MSSNADDGGDVQCEEDDNSIEFENYRANEAAKTGADLFAATVGAMERSWVSFNEKRMVARNESYLYYQSQVKYAGDVLGRLAGELQGVLDGELYRKVRESRRQEIATRGVSRGARSGSDEVICSSSSDGGGKRPADGAMEVADGASAVVDFGTLFGAGENHSESPVPTPVRKKSRVVEHHEYDGFTPAEVDVITRRVGVDDSVWYQYPPKDLACHPVPPAYDSMKETLDPCLVEMSSCRWFERGDSMEIRDLKGEAKWRHTLSYGDVMACKEKNGPVCRVYVYKEQRVYCTVVDDTGATWGKKKDSKDLRPWDWENDVAGCVPKYCPRSGPHVVGQDRVWEVGGVVSAAGVRAVVGSAVGTVVGEGGGVDGEAVGHHVAGSATESSAAGEAPHVGGEGN